jgi:hypothetical protein
LGPVLITLGQLLIVWLLLFAADRWLHRHLQGVMLLLTHDREIALWLYALVLLPGVLLHEVSHAATAALLGVQIGRLSLLPQREQGRIQLGFVPVEETDFIRASLIGAAPLFLGSGVILAIGYLTFGTPEVIAALGAGDLWGALHGLRAALHAPDAWIWAYVVFAVSNTMLPSRADVHAWPFLAAALIIAAVIAVIAGAGAILLQGLSQFLTHAARWIILLGGSTLLIDLPFFLFIFLVERGLIRLTGREIVYE